MKTSNKKVNEKIILLSIIGSLDAIKEEAVSIDEIEKFLFSPHIYHKLKQKGYSGDILQIIEEGCELEDIFSLLPDKFDGVIDNMRRKSLLLLKNYEEYNHFFFLQTIVKFLFVLKTPLLETHSHYTPKTIHHTYSLLLFWVDFLL